MPKFRILFRCMVAAASWKREVIPPRPDALEEEGVLCGGNFCTGSMMAIVFERWEDDLILSMISFGSASLIRWLGTGIENFEF